MTPAFPYPQDRPFDIVGIGRNSWDRLALVGVYPPRDAKCAVLELDHQPGGQVATTLVAAARLGAKIRYLGKFGDDENGRAVREALGLEGIDLSESKTVAGAPNPSSFIVVDQKHKTRNVFGHVDPRLKVEPSDFRADAVAAGKILYIGGRHPEDVAGYARMGREAGCIVAIDADTVCAGTEELVSLADIVVCPEAFPAQFTGEKSLIRGLRTISDYGPSLVCCTRGAKGVMSWIKGEPYESPAFDVNVVDTTGAGDVFQGALLAGLLENLPARELLAFANAAAAMKCRHIGGQRGTPRRPEIEQFLRSN